MLLDILWNNESTQVDLADGTVTVGGSPKDDISIAGLPHGLLTLTVMGRQVSVMAQRSVRIGRALFPARKARLLVDGEDLTLPNDVILRRSGDTRRESRRNLGTACVADGLLSGAAPEVTRGASFTCVAGPNAGVVFPLPFERHVLGRAEGAEVRLTDRSVSRRHALLQRRGSSLVLSPEPSAMNGVFVNGVRVKRERVLADGDIVGLGQSQLRFDAAIELGVPEAIPTPLVAEPLPTPPVAAPTPGRSRVAPALMGVGLFLALAGLGVAFAVAR
jgi:hypothetical protein